MSKRDVLLCAAAFVVFGPGALFAQNRFFIEDQTLKVGDTGVKILLKADTDSDRYGFAFALKYDPAVLEVKDVLVDPGVAAGADWSHGEVFNSPDGKLHWAVVPDLNPPIDKVIKAGTGLLFANIVVDVKATVATTTDVTPQDGLQPNDKPAGGWTNIMTFKGDSTVHPTLQKGKITIQTATTPPPAKPTGVVATGGDATVNVKWNANTEADLQGYNVYRDGAKANTTLVTGTTFDDPGRTNGQQYCYTVRAVNPGGESPDSDQSCATPAAAAGGGWKRCDANADGKIDLSDPVGMLHYLFVGDFTPACLGALNCDGKGKVDLTDAVFLLAFEFQGGEPPPAPFPACNTDLHVNLDGSGDACKYANASICQ